MSGNRDPNTVRDLLQIPHHVKLCRPKNRMVCARQRRLCLSSTGIKHRLEICVYNEWCPLRLLALLLMQNAFVWIRVFYHLIYMLGTIRILFLESVLCSKGMHVMWTYIWCSFSFWSAVEEGAHIFYPHIMAIVRLCDVRSKRLMCFSRLQHFDTNLRIISSSLSPRLKTLIDTAGLFRLNLSTWLTGTGNVKPDRVIEFKYQR